MLLSGCFQCEAFLLYSFEPIELRQKIILFYSIHCLHIVPVYDWIILNRLASMLFHSRSNENQSTPILFHSRSSENQSTPILFHSRSSENQSTPILFHSRSSENQSTPILFHSRSNDFHRTGI
jgi:hypothetical protein